MIKNDYVEIFINNYNYKKLSKSYGNILNIELNTLVEIPIKYLPLGSGYKIEVECDFCNKIFKIEYRKYIKSVEEIGKCCCGSKSCFILKTKETNIKRYGVTNVMHLEINKDKIKKTNIEKYGVDSFSKTDEFIQKTKKTNLERYNTEYLLSSPKYIDKFKKTCLERYGFDSPFKHNDIKDKIKNKLLNKYGVNNYSKTNDYKEKVKETSLERYGVSSYSKTIESKEKSLKTYIEKYGVDNPMKLPKIKEKTKQTNIEKYGFDNPMKSFEIKEKAKQTNIEKYGFDNPNKSDLVRKNFIIANDPNYLKYKDDNISIFNCDKGHEFEITSHNYFSRIKYNTPLCTICNPIGSSYSIKEDQLYNYIKSIYNEEVIKSYRDGLEIDIYLPNLKIGFEFNGLYWHSELFKEKNYHLEKTNYFKEKGIKIIHIWEDDWVFKSEIIKSLIKDYIGIYDNIILASDCKIQEIKDIKFIRSFLTNNHIEGWIKSDIKLGLYYNNKLVSMMLFSKKNINEWTLSRFCNLLHYKVIDGKNKLLNFFVNKYNPSNINMYLNLDYLNLDLEYKIIKHLKPDYKYFVENKRINKKEFKKLNNEKYTYKIWDCGKLKTQILLK